MSLSQRAARAAFGLSMLAGCLLLQEVFAMVAPQQVFTDARVVSLAQAVADGNVDATNRALASGADVKAKGKKGFTVTHFALYAKGHGPAVLKALLAAGADPVSRLDDGSDVPHYAAARDEADPLFVQVLLDAGVSPNLIGGAEDNSLLHASVAGRNPAVTRLLIARGADVNYNHPFVGTALHTALTIPDYRLAALLLESGANPNLRSGVHPSIARDVPRLTPAEEYCRFQSGKRKHPSSQQVADFETMKQAFARRGVVFPCPL
jgi:ankyrin repeat protein